MLFLYQATGIGNWISSIEWLLASFLPVMPLKVFIFFVLYQTPGVFTSIVPLFSQSPWQINEVGTIPILHSRELSLTEVFTSMTDAIKILLLLVVSSL